MPLTAFIPILVALAVPPGLWWWARRAPAPQPREVPADEATRQALRTVLLLPVALMVFFGTVAVLAAPFWALARTLARYRPDPGMQVVHLFQPEALWLLPALFFGLVAAYPLLQVIFQGLLRGRLDHILHSGPQFAGTEALLLVLSLAVALACGVFLFLAADSYAVFARDRIVINRFAGIGEQSYGYDRITALWHQRLRRSPVGKVLEQPHFTLVLDDGATWDTFYAMNDPADPAGAALFEFLSERTRLPVVETDLLDEDAGS